MAKNSGKPKRRDNMIWWVTGAAVAAVGLMVGISLLSAKPKASDAPAGGGTQIAAKTDAELGAARNVKGADAAPAKVVEFGDFQ